MRTLEDFVEDMVSNGADPIGVRAVASQTRWKERKKEAEIMAAKLCKKFKILPDSPATKADNSNVQEKT